MKKLNIIISGGGTGGHIFPAIAIADAIKAQAPQADIQFVGALGKMEMERVPKAGYPITGLPISGLQRRLSWQNVKLPFKLIGSLLKAVQLVRKHRPGVVIGAGGYASGPMLAVAGMMGIPTLIQEQNAYAGITNKLLARRAKRICVAYPGMEAYFPAGKLRLTGNPVRQDIVTLASLAEGAAEYQQLRQAAANHYGLDPGRPTVLIAGGSLGARTLNEAMMGLDFTSAQQQQTQWLWQCGKVYAARCEASEAASRPNVKVLPFIDRMDLAYALADVVVCRAGALTIAELCVLGKPAILVPSPNVAEDHQTKNARALADRGAAVMVADAAIGAELGSQVMELLAKDSRRAELAANARKMGFPAAATEIAGEALALIETNKTQ
jgi:UDP-N-acetylglucosamine--N-acetylmuramyl-(pentapeptide) pyrophosphoryl-undecaprenol N-acetylglucosamine transferase